MLHLVYLKCIRLKKDMAKRLTIFPDLLFFFPLTKRDLSLFIKDQLRSHNLNTKSKQSPNKIFNFFHLQGQDLYMNTPKVSYSIFQCCMLPTGNMRATWTVTPLPRQGTIVRPIAIIVVCSWRMPLQHAQVSSIPWIIRAHAGLLLGHTRCREL